MINYAISAGPHYTHWHTTHTHYALPGLEPSALSAKGVQIFRVNIRVPTQKHTLVGGSLHLLSYHCMFCTFHKICLFFYPVCVCYCGVAWWIVSVLLGDQWNPPLFFCIWSNGAFGVVHWNYRVVVTLTSYGQAHDLFGFRLYKHVHSLFAFRSGAHIWLPHTGALFLEHTWRAYMAIRLDRERLEEILHVLQRLIPIYDCLLGLPASVLISQTLVVGYTNEVLCKSI